MMFWSGFNVSTICVKIEIYKTELFIHTAIKSKLQLD
jgi:hypothetical protein